MTAATEFLPILAAAQAPGGALVVSLHDVAPVTRPGCEEILERLKQIGVRTTSLLVVPDYHRRGKAVDDPEFISWLRALAGDGHEVVIHGYFHERPRRREQPWRHRLITSIYTRDEGEFFDLEYSEAFDRITRAAEEFRAAGLAPVGFIAPAWLLGADGERAAADAGMQYTTRLTNVLDLLEGETQRAQSLVYSTRAAWRRQLSLVWNAALARSMATAELVRISIHPPDLSAPDVWRQLRRLTDNFAREREVTTYRDWVSERRMDRRAS